MSFFSSRINLVSRGKTRRFLLSELEQVVKLAGGGLPVRSFEDLDRFTVGLATNRVFSLLDNLGLELLCLLALDCFRDQGMHRLQNEFVRIPG